MADWSTNGDWAPNGDWEGVLAGTSVASAPETESAQAVTPILGTEVVLVGVAIETESGQPVSIPSLVGFSGWGIPVGI